MFTVEFDHDNFEIVVLDDNGFHQDIRIDSFDDIVYIRQWNEEKNHFTTITISPDMWNELIESLHKPEGAYHTR